MSHSYSSKYPQLPVDDAIVKFFETFYKTSDTPDAHEKYASSFTRDATFVLASKTSKGHDEILATRKGMWATVESRLHDAIKVFPFGPDASEVMLYGTVAFVLKDGRRATVDWAARAEMAREEEEGGELKMRFYQVYLDTAAMAAAK